MVSASASPRRRRATRSSEALSSSPSARSATMGSLTEWADSMVLRASSPEPGESFNGKGEKPSAGSELYTGHPLRAYGDASLIEHDRNPHAAAGEDPEVPRERVARERTHVEGAVRMARAADVLIRIRGLDVDVGAGRAALRDRDRSADRER